MLYLLWQKIEIPVHYVRGGSVCVKDCRRNIYCFHSLLRGVSKVRDVRSTLDRLLFLFFQGMPHKVGSN